MDDWMGMQLDKNKNIFDGNNMIYVESDWHWAYNKFWVQNLGFPQDMTYYNAPAKIGDSLENLESVSEPYQKLSAPLISNCPTPGGVELH